MCLITRRIQRVVSSKTVICSTPVDYTYFNDNGKDSLLLRHVIHKHFRVSFDHEDKKKKKKNAFIRSCHLDPEAHIKT